MRRDGGKGDKPRPFTDKEQFDKNWDAIFKKKPEEQWDPYEYLCPNCVNPWKCNGPHIEDTE
jgi:hypothetical protein